MSGDIARRGFLKAMGATVIVAGGISASRGQSQQAVPWSRGTEPPNLKAPPNACDCHMHIYDSRFPVAPNAKLRPPDATADAYRLFQQRIGTTRNVVVTPSTYGTDNSCTLDAMAKLHLERLLGERLDEGVIHRFHDNDAVHRDADLAHVGEGATRRRCRRFLNVGVIQDDERTLSAEFER